MSIVVKDLLKLELFQNIIKLVSDGSGMESPVNWPYIKQTAEIRPWLNGGEIVFVTGNSNDKTDKEQIALLMEGIECKVAAFVFLCGDEYINKLSDKVIDFANSVKIPVFTMPYDVKLIDVVKEIANAIMESGSRERMIMNFMTDLLHGNFKNDDHIRKQGYECGINIDQNCMAMSIETNFDYEGESYSQIMSYRGTMDYMLKRIEQIGRRYGIQTATSFNVERSVCLFVMENTDSLEMLCQEIDEFLDYYFKYNELTLFVGYGDIHKGVKGCLRSIGESRKTVQFAKKAEAQNISYHYNEMGLLCLLVSSNSKDELMAYCNNVIGSLIKSDRENNTEYILTVKTYLENNNNLVSAANQLFIHRNTLINRLKHIEELTGKSLKEAETKLEYLCVFKLLEFFVDV
ncbi:MAG: PucR family transcriptional regulator ligand-binding domain-containing protein [Clostridia bacterium]|nr:PucR family transcriptional regulator ligand-binding domain-containing protein [Clostridia bacterium]